MKASVVEMKSITTYRVGKLAVRVREGRGSHWPAWKMVNDEFEFQRADRRRREQETDAERINRRIRPGPLKSNESRDGSQRLTNAERIGRAAESLRRASW